MNVKLTLDDREIIRNMLRKGRTHPDIARAFGVSTRTIDREAARMAANTVTVRVSRGLGDPETVVVAGKDVQDVDMDGIVAEAEALMEELEAMDFSDMIAEAERMAAEIEAMDASDLLDVRGLPAEGARQDEYSEFSEAIAEVEGVRKRRPDPPKP